jgi:hypothetical protein
VYRISFAICVLLVAAASTGIGRQITGRTNAGAFAPGAGTKTENDFAGPIIVLIEPLSRNSAAADPDLSTPDSVVTESNLSVKGVVKDPNGVALVLVNGEEAQLKVTPSGAEFLHETLLALGRNEIDIRAVDRFKNESKLVFVVQRDQPLIRGGFYALIIAVQDYQSPGVTSLQFPLQDAQNLVSTLTTNYNFPPGNVTLLRNPTRTAIIRAFDKIAGRLTAEDNLLIFYAGHGYWDEQLKQGFWLPVDASRTSRSEWISNGTVRDYVAGIPAKHTLVISDACFSGGIFKTKDAFPAVSGTPEDLYKLPSRKAITSGALKEVPDKSVFIQYLIKRLKENRAPLLASESLYLSLRTAVLNNNPSREAPQFGEIRETGDEGGDFVFVHR